MNMSKIIKVLLVVGASLGSIACGSGGGNSSPSPKTITAGPYVYTLTNPSATGIYDKASCEAPVESSLVVVNADGQISAGVNSHCCDSQPNLINTPSCWSSTVNGITSSLSDCSQDNQGKFTALYVQSFNASADNVSAKGSCTHSYTLTPFKLSESEL